MPLSVDGFDVLRRIAADPAAFASVKSEANKAARDLVAKQLKARSSGLASVQTVRRALGEDAFALIVDTMKDSELKTLVGRLDKHHPELKSATADWRRRHFGALAAGAVKPSEKTPAKKKSTTITKPKASKPKPAEPERLASEAMRAVRERK